MSFQTCFWPIASVSLMLGSPAAAEATNLYLRCKFEPDSIQPNGSEIIYHVTATKISTWSEFSNKFFDCDQSFMKYDCKYAINDNEIKFGYKSYIYDKFRNRQPFGANQTVINRFSGKYLGINHQINKFEYHYSSTSVGQCTKIESPEMTLRQF